MGVYDTVIVKCPHCSCEADEQYKPGCMRYYNFPEEINEIPYDILTSLQNKRWKCYDCDKFFYTNFTLILKIENPRVTETSEE